MDLKTVLIGLVIFMAVVGRRYIIDYFKGKKSTFDGIKDRAMIDRAIDRLDARFTKPFPAFDTPEDILEILHREPGSEYGMNIFLQAVAGHCGYNRQALMLRAFPPKEGMPPGRITKLGSQFLMELYMDNESEPDGVLAVIIHEFCHFFLDESGLKLEETLENEVLTDTAAVYFGFGRLLRKGYEPHLRYAGDGDVLYRIGYLDTLNIDYVVNQLEKRKPFYDAIVTKDRIPVIKCSICNGEQVAGFKDRKTGQFEGLMLIKSEKDLEEFKRKYRVTDIRKEY